MDYNKLMKQVLLTFSLPFKVYSKTKIQFREGHTPYHGAIVEIEEKDLKEHLYGITT